jgi:hypothetical protein
MDAWHLVLGPPWDQLPPWSPSELDLHNLIIHHRHWLRAQRAMIADLLADLDARMVAATVRRPG